MTLIGLSIWLTLVVGVIVVLGIKLFKKLRNSFLLKYKYFINFESIKCKHNSIPLIKVNIQGKYRHFIVDTGCEGNVVTQTFIDSEPAYNNVVYSGKYTMRGVGHEETQTVPYLIETIKIQKESWKVPFMVTNDIEGTLMSISEDTGLPIIGILGSDFFEESRWLIDFDSKVIWVKK